VKYIASTIVRASDIGLNNNLFGGTLLRWLDEYGALFTYKYLNHRFVTYKMEKTYFLKSAKQGDCIDFYVTNLKFDKISVNFDLVAKINSYKPAKEIINTNMTFVAINVEEEKPQRLNPMIFEMDEFEKCIYQKAKVFMSEDEAIFHNIFHVDEILTQLNMHKATMNPNDYKKLYIAACYHDAIHKPNNITNEEESINILKRDFGKVLSNEDFNDISNMILCTKTNVDYEEIKKYKNADLLHDLDMVSFIDYETMKANDVKIRSEKDNIPVEVFYKQKLSYYEKLMDSGVFISSKYKRYNNIASENIKIYIDEIKELIEKTQTHVE
jgi:acyl-CoA thioesterase YciA